MDKIKVEPRTPSIIPLLPLKSMRLPASHLQTGEPVAWWSLYYVESGVVEISRDGRYHTANPGEGVLLSPGEGGRLLTFSDTPSTVVELNFHANAEELLLLQGKKLSFDRKCCKLLREIIGEAEQYRRLTAAGARAPYASEHYLQLLYEQLMIQLKRTYYAQMKMSGVAKEVAESPSLWEQSIRRSRRDAPSESEPSVGLRGTAPAAQTESANLQLFHKLVDYLRKRIYGSISLDELVGEFHFSKTHLSQIFKTHSGQTILTYYNNLKIEEAKRLIAETDMNFSQISSQLNFSSLHYFSRLFKKHTAMSPSEFQETVTLSK